MGIELGVEPLVASAPIFVIDLQDHAHEVLTSQLEKAIDAQDTPP